MDLKKVGLLIVVAVILFWVFTNPTQAANGISSFLNTLKDGAEAVITFMRNLFA